MSSITSTETTSHALVCVAAERSREASEHAIGALTKSVSSYAELSGEFEKTCGALRIEIKELQSHNEILESALEALRETHKTEVSALRREVEELRVVCERRGAILDTFRKFHKLAEEKAPCYGIDSDPVYSRMGCRLSNRVLVPHCVGNREKSRSCHASRGYPKGRVEMLDDPRRSAFVFSIPREFGVYWLTLHPTKDRLEIIPATKGIGGEMYTHTRDVPRHTVGS